MSRALHEPVRSPWFAFLAIVDPQKAETPMLNVALVNAAAWLTVIGADTQDITP